MEGKKQSGYRRLEEGMVWRQSTGREGYGRWMDVRTSWSSLMLEALHGVTAAMHRRTKEQDWQRQPEVHINSLSSIDPLHETN